MTYILYRQLASKGARAAKLPFAVAMISPTLDRISCFAYRCKNAEHKF